MLTNPRDVEHTAAWEQRRFMALPPEEQMLEIWLNTRETNGHVADAQRQIAELKTYREETLEPWMARVDDKFVAAAAIVGFILLVAPFVFFALNKWG